jgi:hypothetical protein
MKTFREYALNEKSVTIDIDWASEIKNLDKDLSKEYGIKIKDNGNMTADVKGDPKKIKEFLLGVDYGMSEEDIAVIFPELG